MTDVAAMLLAYPGKLEHFDRDELVLGVQECLDCAQTCTAYLCADDLATGRLVAPGRPTILRSTLCTSPPGPQPDRSRTSPTPGPRCSSTRADGERGQPRDPQRPPVDTTVPAAADVRVRASEDKRSFRVRGDPV